MNGQDVGAWALAGDAATATHYTNGVDVRRQMLTIKYSITIYYLRGSL